MGESRIINKLDSLIFGNRRLIIGFFAVVTVFMLYTAVTGLRIDASFTKLLPLKHEYMQTFVKHRQEFGGANRVLIALMAKDGDMFTPEFFDVLRKATDEVFFIDGVDRSRVSSLFTPNVRYTEVVEDGIDGDNVVPADFSPTPAGLAQVRQNILKAGIVGRLVANDFSGAIISAQLMTSDPVTGNPIDPIRISRELEQRIRDKFDAESLNLDITVTSSPVDVHMIGFAKVVGDISDGATRVILFFLVAFIVTAILVFLYSQSLKVTVVPLICSVIAVVWQLGALTLLDYGIDPMGILVPFLVFAIGVSHGVQMISAVSSEIFEGKESVDACRSSFRRLCIPGGIALASDTIGFITILLIDIGVIQEMAVTASLGVAFIILTNLILLPVLLCFSKVSDSYRSRLKR